jgi:hypothetical protein
MSSLYILHEPAVERGLAQKSEQLISVLIFNDDISEYSPPHLFPPWGVPICMHEDN